LEPKLYDLKTCISQHSVPKFGYNLQNFEDEKFKVESVYKSLVAVERQRHMNEHMLKCFTYGREVRHDKAGGHLKQSDKIDEIKK